VSVNSTAAEAANNLEHYFDEGTYAHAGTVAEVLECLPSGDHAWLRSQERAEPDDALYVLTEAGRDLVARMRAEQALFGRPWPTVAETS
jgi:hypothetical protein